MSQNYMNSIEKSFKMQKLEGICMYGDNFEDVPKNIIDEIWNMISKLCLANIYYPDTE